MKKQTIASKEFVQEEIAKASHNFNPLKYNKTVTVNDWVSDDTLFKINILKEEHKIINPIDASVYILNDNNQYIKSHGIYDDTDYMVTIDIDDNITISSTKAFNGRFIIY